MPKIKTKGIKLESLSVTIVPIDSIRPNPYNPNRQSEYEFNLLCRSITEDGFTQPIIVQQDGEIVDGEHRWRAAKKLGMTDIPIVRVNMTEEQRRIATMRHNRARGSEDMELVGGVLRDLEKLGAIDWAKDSLMLQDVEIERLLKDISAVNGIGNMDSFSPAWIPTKTEEVGGTIPASVTPKAQVEATKRLMGDSAKSEPMVTRSITWLALEFKDIEMVCGKELALNILKLCREKLGKESFNVPHCS